MNPSNPHLALFQTLLDFVNELNDFFGKKQKPLALYQRLMVRTQIGDTHIIDRHVVAFRKFCIENRGAIVERDVSKISSTSISFSDRIFINLKPILIEAQKDQDTFNVIWKYLLTISAFVDSESEAKKVLLSDAFKVEGGESTDVLTDLVSTIQKEVEDSGLELSDNPMQMVNNLMQSGAFEKIMESFNSKMDSGELNMGKLMGLAQNMMGKLTQDMGNDPMMENMMAMMQHTIGQMPSELTPSPKFTPSLQSIPENSIMDDPEFWKESE